jgi:hypothetical protein
MPRSRGNSPEARHRVRSSISGLDRTISIVSLRNRCTDLFGRDLQHAYGVGGEALAEVRAKAVDGYSLWDRLDLSGRIGSSWIASQKNDGAVRSDAGETGQREVHLLRFEGGVYNFDVERAALGVPGYTGVDA